MSEPQLFTFEALRTDAALIQLKVTVDLEVAMDIGLDGICLVAYLASGKGLFLYALLTSVSLKPDQIYWLQLMSMTIP